MSDHCAAIEQVPTFCALCISRCGAIATLKDGRLTALSPDPSHPTDKALCIKGKVAPELVYHPDRLLHPMKLTRPKDATNPGWQQISWDEALNTVTACLGALAEKHGPETVVFNSASPSTSAIDDSIGWLRRLSGAMTQRPFNKAPKPPIWFIENPTRGTHIGGGRVGDR
jgi:anaerobic selenocysteine-containing dehydrogenase